MAKPIEKIGAGGRNRTDMGWKPRGILSQDPTIRRFPTVLITYKSIGCKSQVGIAWVNLGYFRLRRLHFDYTQ